MNNKWFIIINGKEEGPYTATDLRNHPYVTPDTLACPAGLSTWTPIRNIEELSDIFKDDDEAEPIQERFVPKKGGESILSQDEEVAFLRQDPYQFWLWLLVIILVLIYVLYQSSL